MFTKIARFKKDALARKALSLAVGLCLLSGALMFLGCDTDSGGDEWVDDNKLNTNLIGTWSSTYGDAYTITATTLSYGSSGTINYAGTIKYVSTFSNTAGVIIIEYDDDKKQKYYSSYDENYNPVGDPFYGPGKFHATYYQDLGSSSVQMAGVYKAGGAEQATLDAAKREFTAGNAGTYARSYGTYTK